MRTDLLGGWRWTNYNTVMDDGDQWRFLELPDGYPVVLHRAQWRIQPAVARLIKAAPDLLKALETAVDSHEAFTDHSGYPCPSDCWSRSAATIIAKAKGLTPSSEAP